MANRSYLYSLSNRPESYADRPETISGLSEWAWYVPFTYRVLMSGSPQLCGSLVTDGFEGEPADKKTRIHAIGSDFGSGFARLMRFFDVLRPMVADASPDLCAMMDEAVAFLEAHRDRYLLLETIELDSMTTSDEAELREAVETEIATCRRVGAAVDALSGDVAEAGARLKVATTTKSPPPFDEFFGLRLDDDCDNILDEKTEYPLGLGEWWDVLYFQLWNKAEFEARR